MMGLTNNKTLEKNLETTYNELLSKIDFSKVDKKTKQEFQELSDVCKNKNKFKRQKSVSRSKIKRLFVGLALATPLIGSCPTALANSTATGEFLESVNFCTTSEQIVKTSFYDNRVKIYDSIKYNFDERIEIITQIQEYAKENDIDIPRSTEHLESEWYIHNVCYNLGIAQSKTKDVDLDYIEDERWYVNYATNVACCIFSLHKCLDSYQNDGNTDSYQNDENASEYSL